MGLRVLVVQGRHRLVGDAEVVELANRWLAHLEVREFSSKTVRAYAFDVLNFARFLEDRSISFADVVSMDPFDWLAWQSAPTVTAGRRVVRLQEARGAAPSTMNTVV